MLDLSAIESIKQLKARYFRALDSKNWPLMESCLAEHCTAAYDNGKYTLHSRQEIVQFFSSFMNDPKLIFMHHGHHPEITVEDDQNASGIWYLQDMVINLDKNTTLHGAGFYHDRYIQQDGHWLICATGYQRTFEEIHSRTDVRLRYNLFADDSHQ